jgi:transposase
MDREALLQLSREALADLVLALTARVAELEAAAARTGGPPKTPANSSVPPSRAFKADRAGRRKKRGPKRGHAGLSRRRRPPDVIVRCRPSHCRGCGAALPEAGQRRVGRSQVVDLPPIRPVTVEAWRYAARCPACGARTVAPVPAGLEPQRTFGPDVEALLAYLHERHHLGYERLVEVLCRPARAGDQRGPDGEHARATGRAGAPGLRRDRGGGAGRAGDQLGRDRRAGGWEDLVALGLPRARGELPRHRPRPRGPGHRRVPRRG